MRLKVGEKLVGSGKFLAASDVVYHPVADVLRTFQLIFDCLHVVMHRIHHLHLNIGLLIEVTLILTLVKDVTVKLVILVQHRIKRSITVIRVARKA